MERDCLLLLSCVQARRDTRFKEEMADLPRRFLEVQRARAKENATSAGRNHLVLYASELLLLL